MKLEKLSIDKIDIVLQCMLFLLETDVDDKRFVELKNKLLSLVEELLATAFVLRTTGSFPVDIDKESTTYKAMMRCAQRQVDSMLRE